MTLTVSHLTFAYPKAPPVLEDVSFTVPAGDFLSVLGANGAGKSTLFRCLLGGLEGYTGAISLDAVSYGHLTLPTKRIGQMVGEAGSEDKI